MPILKGKKYKKEDIGMQLITGDVSELMNAQKKISTQDSSFVKKQIIGFEQPIEEPQKVKKK